METSQHFSESLRNADRAGMDLAIDATVLTGIASARSPSWTHDHRRETAEKLDHDGLRLWPEYGKRTEIGGGVDDANTTGLYAH
jgi:hypothetical protein